MRSKSFLIMAVMMAFLVILAFQTSEATLKYKTLTSSAQMKDSTGHITPVVYYTYTVSVYANRLDTTYVALHPPSSSEVGGSATPWSLVLMSQAGGADSLPSWCLRYQTSMDGKNWVSTTLGTDSTTWTSTLLSTDYPATWSCATIAMTAATYGYRWPYNRVAIWPKSPWFGGALGNKWRLYQLDY